MRFVFLLILGVAAWAMDLPQKLDPKTLDDAVTKLATDVKKLLTERGQNVVALGEIKGPTARAATGGAGVQQRLKAALERLEIKVGRAGPIGIDGAFRFDATPSDHPDEKLRGLTVEALVIQLRITDDSGKELARLETQVLDEGDQAALEGRTFDVPVNASRPDRDEIIKKARTEPPPLTGTIARPSIKSPFGMEIIREGRALPLTNQDGKAFVKLDLKDEYQVRISNSAPFDIAVKLTIDGLSMFEFSEVRDPKTARPSYEFMIVGAKSEAIFKGWHITNERADAFRIVPREDSAAHKLGQHQAMGTVTAVFHAAWKDGDSPPEGELLTTSRSGFGTDRGSKVEQSLTAVQRKIGRVRAAVSIRYDQ